MPLLQLYRQHKSKIRYCLLIFGLFFIASLAMKQKDDISPLIDELNIGLFLLSILIGLAGNIAQGCYFTFLLNKHGHQTQTSLGIKVFLLGQIAKYIPGKIWSIILQDSHLNGTSSTKAVVFANIEMMLGLIFISISITLGLTLGIQKTLLAAFVFVSSAAMFAIISSNERFALGLTSYLEKMLRGQKPETTNIQFQTNTNVWLFTFTLIAACNIGSNALLLNSVFGLPMNEAVIYIALLAASWIIGVCAIVFPSGIGIRELAFIFISSQMLGDYSIETLTSIAVITRFWQILQEIIGVFLAGILHLKH